MSTIDTSPYQVDAVSTATAPLVSSGRTVYIRSVMIQGNAGGQRFRLRHGSMTGPIIVEFLTSATQFAMQVSVKMSYNSGLFVSDLPAGMTAYIYTSK